MDLANYKTVIETIKENYNNIFKAEKKVADFILANPEVAVNCNVSELALHSDVSDATIVRLCKHIGYQGYYQMRIFLSRDLGRQKIIHTDSKSDFEADSSTELFKIFASNLIEIGKNLDSKVLNEASNLIKNCNQAHIVAVGNTSPLAQYMGFRLGRLGIRCTYNMVPEYFMNQVNLAKSDDIVIAISQSGNSKQVVQAMELAKSKKLKNIAITGYVYSPVSALADYLLLSGATENNFSYYAAYSHLRETAVIDALLHFVTNEEKIFENEADTPEIIMSEYKF